MISCRGEQTKKKRAVSTEGEGPATAETTDPLLVPSRLLRVWEARNPKYERSEKGGQGFRKGLPLFFPVKIDGKEPSQVKAITSLFIYVRTPLFQGGTALPPANPAISEPVFPIPCNSMEDFSILAIPSSLSLFLLYKK